MGFLLHLGDNFQKPDVLQLLSVRHSYTAATSVFFLPAAYGEVQMMAMMDPVLQPKAAKAPHVFMLGV